MTNYPNSQDNIITLPGVSGVTDEDIAINALREAAFAIEKELGIVPSGVYSDVRARFDILEARINSPASGIILSDGYTNSPFFIVNTPSAVTLSISDGYGVPTENRIDGSLFMRADGYANHELYIRRSGAWYPMQSDLWVAGGDLSGTYTNQTVIGIRGKSLNVSLATTGATQDGYHLTWNNVITSWEAQTGFIANGDLAILSGPFGRTGQTVVRLQGRTLASTAPSGATSSDGDGLAWDPSTSQWQPRPRAIIFDGYVARSNIRSNKILQSPILNTKTGIVNFGSRSTGGAVGAQEDYSAILSGDRGAATNTFSLIVGGDSHIVSGQYGTAINGLSNIISGQYGSVINGLSNTASSQYSFVGNGTLNTASQTHAFVLDGYSNTASGVNSFVLGGGSNAPAASFSGVLNGISNTITSTSTHAGIGFGSNNAIAGATSTYTIILGGSGNTANGQNIFLGNPTGASVSSAYSAVVSGQTNIINAASTFSFVGAGVNNTLTGLYATILNGTTSTVNGLHGLILNGNTNSVTGSYSTIVNGLNNIISGAVSHAGIFDGYSNTVSISGGLVLGGFSNTVSGLYSTVVNGNGNNFAASNSTVLNGSTNTADAASMQCTVLNGTGNAIIGTINGLISGNTNTVTNASNSYVFGGSNIVLAASSKIIGNSNTVAPGGTFNRIFGSTNALSAGATTNTIFGNSNQLINTANNSVVAGHSNIVDAGGNNVVLGSTNITNGNFSTVMGQYGKSRMFGQYVHANSRFTGGTIGQAQFSRLILTGTANSGAAIQCLLQDAAPTPPTFVDGYSYDMQIRVLVVNTSPISPNPVVPARFVFDVLAHQEGGVLILDNINQSVITLNTSDDPTGVTRTVGWSVSVTASTNQLLVTVDPEISSANYVQPTNTASNRRAIATIDMREVTRL